MLNEKLSGTPIADVTEKMKEIEPLLAANISRHEILFQAFMNAFVRFASESVYYSGQSNMLYQPEFADIEKLKQIMSMLEDSSLWKKIGNHEGDLAIRIGTNELIQLDDIAIVASKFKMNGSEEGQLMVVGPTRMQYNQVVALLEYMSQALEALYRDDSEE